MYYTCEMNLNPEYSLFLLWAIGSRISTLAAATADLRGAYHAQLVVSKI